MNGVNELSKLRIVLAANIVDGYPSEFEYTRDFLLSNNVGHLTTIAHPLQRRSASRSTIHQYKNGVVHRKIGVRRPNHPPFTHILDGVTGLLPIKSDIWIGFNPIMTAMGAMIPRTKILANWAIDFVPHRGERGIVENGYRQLEKFMMSHLDVQIENSVAALEARTMTTGIVPPCQLIAPIGVWDESFAEPLMPRHQSRRVVYFGSMDNRNGVPFLADLLTVLIEKDQRVQIDLIGEGESSPLVKTLANRFPNQVNFHGYIEDQKQIDLILRGAVVALAPYDETPGSFTKFADPQKLKYYASNGVPVILTDVAPAAVAMKDAGAAKLLSQADGHEAWVSAVMHWLDNSNIWLEAASSSFQYAKSFERNNVYSKTFSSIIQELSSK